ncbi:hypothetical protein K490DRAFT_56587 [Saccharata proteae CBS 121410]|uniref:Uncharacterized protein n=1 Tax=Saccharata proteae CBS 121410 TaxID=1314787 RepID=A0A9P4HWF7_9PEZI|nr:hypothetical protein K490DRAFT_56587 [Saccharata proteae CBS 121410]
MKLRNGTSYEHRFPPRIDARDARPAAAAVPEAHPDAAIPAPKSRMKRKALDTELAISPKRARLDTSQPSVKESVPHYKAGHNSANARLKARKTGRKTALSHKPAHTKPVQPHHELASIAPQQAEAAVQDGPAAGTRGRKRQAIEAADADGESAAKKARQDDVGPHKFPWFGLPGELKTRIHRELMPTTKAWEEANNTNRRLRQEGKPELPELVHPARPYGSFDPGNSAYFAKVPDYKALDVQFHHELVGQFYKDRTWVVEPAKESTLKTMPQAKENERITGFFPKIKHLVIKFAKIYGNQEHKEDEAWFNLNLDTRRATEVLTMRSERKPTATASETNFMNEAEAVLRALAMEVWRNRRNNIVISRDIETMCALFRRHLMREIILKAGPLDRSLERLSRWLRENP